MRAGSQGGERGGRDALPLALLLLLALLPHAPLLGLPFASDDYHAIAHARSGLEAVARDVSGPQFGAATVRFWRPLVTASLALDVALHGTAPGRIRATNLLAHACSVLLLYAIGRRVGLSRAASFLAAALWATFPYGPGSVVWIVGRVDSLLLPFAFAGLALSLGPPNFRNLRASGLLFAAALLVKEEGVAVPVVACATGLVLRPRGELLPRVALAAALLGAYFVIRRLALGTWLGGYPVSVPSPFAAGGGLFRVAAECVAPDRVVAVPARAALFAALGFVGVLSLRSSWTRRRVSAGALWWILGCLPLASTLLEPGNLPNLRAFAFPFAGVAVLCAAAILPPGRATPVRLALASALLLSQGAGLLAGLRDHARAGRAVESILRGVAEEAPGSIEPVFVEGVPRAAGSAYVFNWGFPNAFAPPFRRGGPEVRLLRRVFEFGPSLEGRSVGPAGRGLLRFDGEAIVAVSRGAPRDMFAVRSEGLGPRLGREALLAAYRSPARDWPVRFASRPPGPLRVVLFTGMGYGAAPLEAEEPLLVRDVLLARLTPTLTLAHLVIQAFDLGERDFGLLFESELSPAQGTSDLLEVHFDDDVAAAFRTFYL